MSRGKPIVTDSKYFYARGCASYRRPLESSASPFLLSLLLFLPTFDHIGECFFNKISHINIEGISIKWIILGVGLLLIIFIFAIFMNTPQSSAIEPDMTATLRILNDPNRNFDIARRIFMQYQINLERERGGLDKLHYMAFPSSHPAHLDLNRRVRLVEILANDPLTADKYQFGSSIGVIYKPRTYYHPNADAYMIVATFNHEYNSG